MPRNYKLKDIQVVTKNGECSVSIAIELDININADGISVRAKEMEEEKKSDEVKWEIPDFTSEKINFGKDVT